MDFVGQLLNVSAPSGMWANIINWLNGGLANYAVTIIVLTLIIKAIFLPIDFVQRLSSQKNMTIQAKLKPQLDAINKKYQGNTATINQKTMELYRKEHYSIGGSCLIMLIYMVLNIVVFFTLLGGLNKMAAYKIDSEYRTLKTTYYEIVQTDPNNEELKKQASEAVVKKYDEIKEGFLWIKNIWGKDTNSKVVLTYKDFLKNTGQKAADVNEEEYNTVMAPLVEKYKNTWNGYYILCVLSVLTTYLSMKIPTWITKFKNKKKGLANTPEVGSGKFMPYLMSAFMVIFALLYNAAFAIYIVASSLFSLITNPLLSIIIDKILSRKKEDNVKKVSYSR